MTEIRRDRWGRPFAPDPETGAERVWTRATTLAETITDRFGLERWKLRQVVRGFAAREDLLVRAVGAGDDRDELDRIVEVAHEAAGAGEAAAVGTALHSITERIDRGEEVEVPTSFRADVEAYRVVCERAGLRVAEGWIERFVICPQVGAAGTPDRLYEPAEIGLPMIGDIKTGTDVLGRHSVKIAAQLAIYSRATHWYDGHTLHRMPKVDQGMGIVAHMPARAGRCDLYAVDLHRGWEIAQLCHTVRRVRTSEGLLQPLSSWESDPRVEVDAEEDRRIRERVREVVAALEGKPLPHPWPAGIDPPRRRPEPYGSEEIRRIRRWCDRVASHTTAVPF